MRAVDHSNQRKVATPARMLSPTLSCQHLVQFGPGNKYIKFSGPNNFPDVPAMSEPAAIITRAAPGSERSQALANLDAPNSHPYLASFDNSEPEWAVYEI